MKVIALILIAVGGIAAWYFLSVGLQNSGATSEVPPSEIRTFADCEKAGHPIMESYPRRCAVPDGRTFAEEIVVSPTYENASADMIKVELPFPGAVTGKEFSVIGQARGGWFFEASFPVEVVDENGKVLAQTFATAGESWMTTEFVPFRSEVKIPSSFTGNATLILHKDNPSGLPENDASISFPITIEY